MNNKDIFLGLKPRIDFKNIKEAKNKAYGGSHRPWTDHHNANEFPCIDCQGIGKYRRWEDRCPIEGWKMAPWVKCPHCKTGIVSKEKFMAWYNAQMAKYNDNMSLYKEKLQRYRELEEIKKLAVKTI
jgi:hypothetical protein